MKKFKINGQVVEANSLQDALSWTKSIHDSIQDVKTTDLIDLLNRAISSIEQGKHDSAKDYINEVVKSLKFVNTHGYDSINDSIHDASRKEYLGLCGLIISLLQQRKPSSDRLAMEYIEKLTQWSKTGLSDSFDDAPDTETPSGRKQMYEQMCMSALDVVPTNMWNKSGNKINIDNNRITLIFTENGIELRQKDAQLKKFTNKDELKSELENFLEETNGYHRNTIK